MTDRGSSVLSLLLAGCVGAPAPAKPIAPAPVSEPATTVPAEIAPSAPAPAVEVSAAEADVVRELEQLVDFLATPVTLEDIVRRLDATDVAYRRGSYELDVRTSAWLVAASVAVTEKGPSYVAVTLRHPVSGAALMRSFGELIPFQTDFGEPWSGISDSLDRGGAFLVSVDLEAKSWRGGDVGTMRGTLVVLQRDRAP